MSDIQLKRNLVLEYKLYFIASYFWTVPKFLID